MTVANFIPVVEYTGNGVITQFDWDWDMIDDSSINVLVDNENITEYTEQGQSVIFDTAPAADVVIQIYRRTTVWMPEDYIAFGRFHPDKTELGIDRATMIMQERLGDAINDEEPNGIVGGANLSITRSEFTIDVNSERGTDATLPMWVPDDGVVIPPAPDSSIIWAGDDILSNTVLDDGSSSRILFKMSLVLGDPAEASAQYDVNNTFEYVGWLNVDPNDNEYWMRVFETGTTNPKTRIYDSTSFRAFGEEFQIFANPVAPTEGPSVEVDTFGDTAPSTQVATVRIEICKDSGGEPDNEWVTRNVRLEARRYA